MPVGALAGLLQGGAGVAVGAMAGFLLAALGAGGSLFIVPVLVFLFHLPFSTATGTSLGVVFAGSLVGALAHARRGGMSPRVVLPFGAAAMAGAVLGSHLHDLVSESFALACFAAALGVAAYRMARGIPGQAVRPHVRLARLLPLGAGVGALTGFLGVGGGFLIVPVLIEGVGLPMRSAVGTSLAVMALSSASGAASHAAQGNVELGLLLSVSGGAIAGALLGVPLASRVPERPLRLSFALLAGLLAVYMLGRAGALPFIS